MLDDSIVKREKMNEFDGFDSFDKFEKFKFKKRMIECDVEMEIDFEVDVDCFYVCELELVVKKCGGW